MKKTGIKNIKMICPDETAENAKLAKIKVSRLMSECSRVGRKETKWIIAETVTRVFVSFYQHAIMCGLVIKRRHTDEKS